MKNSFEEADELDGFDDLTDEDKDKIRVAWEDGKVADEDIPDTAQKPEGEEDEEEDEEKPKKKAPGRKKKTDADENGEPQKSVFKLEYASSSRAKCKTCGDSVGKGFFRLGQEVDFRGHKAVNWRHFGCADAKMIASMQASYSESSEIDGFNDLKPAEQEKVQRAWDAGEVPEEDQGPGEAVETAKKAAPKRKKKDEDGEEEKPKRSRAKKAKDDDDEEEKPKRKRAPAAEKKTKAPAKKSKKKTSDDDSGEDFGNEIAAVGDDEEEEEEEEPAPKKRKTAPAPKGKPASKAKPAASRGRKKAQESEVEDDYE
ncbi:hypothetical protein EVJ58_g8959 [Rhodofomes roseus]|uniref:PARP-type domain-containing protein n=1 Tax=Rhodofomes roseus TaxID=34475 RepID=A0A4Y9Y092_9APHY|nr:hypothetical protein EVJ58_g8959 [Rhodofomes roseus]